MCLKEWSVGLLSCAFRGVAFLDTRGFIYRGVHVHPAGSSKEEIAFICSMQRASARRGVIQTALPAVCVLHGMFSLGRCPWFGGKCDLYKNILSTTPLMHSLEIVQGLMGGVGRRWHTYTGSWSQDGTL